MRPDSPGETEDIVREQVAEQARKNGLVWLEGYEAMLKDFLDLEAKVAEGTGAEWATTLAHAHANFVRSTSEVMLGAMRQQLVSVPPAGRPVPG